MGDLWRKPSLGDKLTFSATLRGKTIDTIRDVQRMKRTTVGNIDRMGGDRGVIKIKNESDADVGRFGILGLNGITAGITPADNLAAWKNQFLFSGVEPATPDHYGKFCILLEPIADDAQGLACVSGVVPVQVSFTYSDSPYADVLDGDDAKLVGSEGGMPILYKETGTGTKWALVQMGVPYYPTIRGKLDDDLDAGSSEVFSVWDGATLADTNRNVTLYDWFITASSKIASGTKCSATWRSGKWYLEVPGACETDQ